MLTDPAEYAARRSGPWVSALRLDAVADDLELDLHERGEKIINITRDARSRFWHHAVGKPSVRKTPAAIGKMLRARFQELTQLPLSGDSLTPKTWRIVAEMVAEGFRNESKTQTVETWVLANVVSSPGDYITRGELLQLVQKTLPGPDCVRGREISAALVSAGLATDAVTRRRQRDTMVKTWENIRVIS